MNNRNRVRPNRVRPTRNADPDNTPEAEAEDEDLEEGVEESEDQDDDQSEEDAEAGDGDQETEAAEDPVAEDDTDESEPEPAPPEQLGFAKRIGAQSTKPVKLAPTTRPYLDSPRPFGIHIKGHLVRFEKGRTPINKHAFKHHDLTVNDILDALRTDGYVADNGAELVE